MHSKNNRRYNNHRGAPYDAAQSSNDATSLIAGPSTATPDAVAASTGSNVAPSTSTAANTVTVSTVQSSDTAAAPRRHVGRRRTSALILAAVLATASLTACSLASEGSNTPGTAASSQSRNRNTAPSAGKTSATSDKKNSPSSSSSKPSKPSPTNASGSHVENAHLCGGLFSKQSLKDDFSFESSEKKYAYWNKPPDEHGAARMTCSINDKNNNTNIDITYGGNSALVNKLAQEAESNEDGSWEAITINGQEGKGWVTSGAILHRAVWVYPDGSGFVASIMAPTDSTGAYTKDHISLLAHKLVGTIATHNQTAGIVNDSQY